MGRGRTVYSGAVRHRECSRRKAEGDQRVRRDLHRGGVRVVSELRASVAGEVRTKILCTAVGDVYTVPYLSTAPSP